MRLPPMLLVRGGRVPSVKPGRVRKSHLRTRLIMYQRVRFAGWCAPQEYFFRLALPSFRAQRFAFTPDVTGVMTRVRHALGETQSQCLARPSGLRREGRAYEALNGLCWSR